jgi:hypothetical protein
MQNPKKKFFLSFYGTKGKRFIWKISNPHLFQGTVALVWVWLKVVDLERAKIGERTADSLNFLRLKF